MARIDPTLFARIMRLPQSARAELFEVLGGTAVSDSQLSDMIEKMSQTLDPLSPLAVSGRG